MRLRTQLLALSVLTLVLPWSGWQLVQELEDFLRQSEEAALLNAAAVMAKSVPQALRSELISSRGQMLPLRQFGSEPIVDGFYADWPEPDQFMQFESNDELLQLKVLAGRFRSETYLMLDVTDLGEVAATTINATAGNGPKAGVMLYLQSNRSQHGFMISTEAPGELTAISLGDPNQRLQAAWFNTANGYRIELELPIGVERIGVAAVVPTTDKYGNSVDRFAGTLKARSQGAWLELTGRQELIPFWLQSVAPDQTRAWLLQADGWVMGDSGFAADEQESELTWVQRLIYQGVATSSMPIRNDLPEWPVRIQNQPVEEAQNGQSTSLWSRDLDSAAVYNLVAVPVIADHEAIGVVVLEARSEGLLLMTNRALGRLLTITFLVVVILAAGLWLFASRLSRRVQQLSGAVSRAMDQHSAPSKLPQTKSSDEVGELARNTEKLLKAVAEYTVYLQKLAGRLSHELKTPIAITRSSLDNLASQDLGPEAVQYLERAQEGLDRQAAIVSAMSEAQRLEGAVKSADWEKIDLTKMLRNSVESYRAVHPSRNIQFRAPSAKIELRCAPDLLAQALDKLVDNAISLSAPECEVNIGLELEDGFCLLNVSNQGSRLPEVLHEQLFDSLVSLRNEATSSQHLGLGLYIVRLVAEAHSGSVSARNLEVDSGVEFVIQLPLRG
jgi:dedicated sortase system histidine kinase